MKFYKLIHNEKSEQCNLTKRFVQITFVLLQSWLIFPHKVVSKEKFVSKLCSTNSTNIPPKSCY